MLPKTENLIAWFKGFYSRLTPWQRMGVVVVVGALIVVFLGTVGVKSGPGTMQLSDFKPYRPERPAAGGVGTLGQAPLAKEGAFPRPPGPGVEATILDEMKSLRAALEDLRSSVLAQAESAPGPDDEVKSALSALHAEVKTISSELKALREKAKKDEQSLKEQAPIDLIAILAAGGFNYAILRTEAGEKRVTEGDKVGPWMVEEISGKEVRLSTSTQKRILTVK